MLFLLYVCIFWRREAETSRNRILIRAILESHRQTISGGGIFLFGDIFQDRGNAQRECAETTQERDSMTRRDSGKRTWKAALSIYLVLFLLPQGGLWAQGEASINGTVSDETGAVIAGATVKVKNVETGAVRTLVTDSAGRYEAPRSGRREIRSGRGTHRLPRRVQNRHHAGHRTARGSRPQAGAWRNPAIHQRGGHGAGTGRDHRGIFRPGGRDASEKPAAQRPQLRPTADAQSRRSSTTPRSAPAESARRTRWSATCFPLRAAGRRKISTC